MAPESVIDININTIRLVIIVVYVSWIHKYHVTDINIKQKKYYSDSSGLEF